MSATFEVTWDNGDADIFPVHKGFQLPLPLLKMAPLPSQQWLEFVEDNGTLHRLNLSHVRSVKVTP